MRPPIEERPNGADLVGSWNPPTAEYSFRHRGHHCPKCDEDLGRVALINIVYAFRICECGDPDFIHLVEQLWHATCFAEAKP